MPPVLRESIPRFVEPMLARTRATPSGDQWAFEVKWDGARMQVRFDGRSLSMRWRHGRACADEFPEVAALAETLAGHRIVLDGELVSFARDGKPDFAALRARFGRRHHSALSAAQQRSPVRLIVFDVLHVDGRAVRQLPYIDRRDLLEELELHGPPGAPHGTSSTQRARRSSPPPRTKDSRGSSRNGWTRPTHPVGGAPPGSNTCIRREWFVIAGWRERPGALPEFLLARRHGGDLVPAGSASLGLGAEQRTALIAARSDHELPGRRPARLRPLGGAASRGLRRRSWRASWPRARRCAARDRHARQDDERPAAHKLPSGPRRSSRCKPLPD